MVLGIGKGPGTLYAIDYGVILTRGADGTYSEEPYSVVDEQLLVELNRAGIEAIEPSERFEDLPAGAAIRVVSLAFTAKGGTPLEELTADQINDIERTRPAGSALHVHETNFGSPVGGSPGPVAPGGAAASFGLTKLVKVVVKEVAKEAAGSLAATGVLKGGKWVLDHLPSGPPPNHHTENPNPPPFFPKGR